MQGENALTLKEAESASLGVHRALLLQFFILLGFSARLRASAVLPAYTIHSLQYEAGVSFSEQHF